jgi:uncharacterized membrane protein YgdD (TMEM256/DUF423 family)
MVPRPDVQSFITGTWSHTAIITFGTLLFFGSLLTRHLYNFALPNYWSPGTHS